MIFNNRDTLMVRTIFLMRQGGFPLKVVIIGASFAGITAALAIREQHQAAEIYLIEKQNDIGFLPGGLNLYFKHTVKQLDEARFVTQEMLQQKGIQLLLNREVIGMDVQQQVITFINEEKAAVFSYDKLILATGSSQWSQQIVGSQSNRLLKYKFLPGAFEALQQLESSQSVAIIGGGQIGVEAIDSLIRLNKQVHLFESMDYLLSKYFDEEMIAPVQQEMEKLGVTFHFGETVTEIQETEKAVIVITQKSAVSTDNGIFALNIRPQLTFLDKRIQQRTDQTISVDDYLQTSVANVFAIGDCIDVDNQASKEKLYIPLVNNAIRTGLVVASNLIRPKIPFVGSLRTIGTKLLDYYVASTGLTEEESLFQEAEIGVTHVEQLSSPLASGEAISGKLIYDKQSHRILGAQLVSKVNCLEKINTLALSIQTGQTLESLYQKDYFYQPSFASVIDITNQLGAQALWSESHED